MHTRDGSKSSSRWILFSVYIVFLTLLPSGTIYGVNVKVIVFIPLAIFVAQSLAQETMALAQFAFCAALLGIVAAATVRSFANPFYSDLALSQAKDVITTFAGCLFVRVFTATEIDRERFVRLCLYTVSFGSLLKVVLLVYSLHTGTAVSDIVDHISLIFGVKLMSMELGDIGGRLQLPSDNLLPIVMFIVIGLRRRLGIGGPLAVAIVCLLTVSSLYTFSRFIWVSTVLGAALGMLISRRDKMVLLYLAIIGAVTAFFFPMLSTLITLRFSSSLADTSDMYRVWQIVALKRFFWNAPLFGNGLGSYALDHKRSVEVPYAYEVQILALLGQMGLVGTAFLIALLINYYRKAFNFRPGTRLYHAVLLVLLIDFIGAGFFNPDLLVSMSAVSYGLIFVMARMWFRPEKASIKSCRVELVVPSLPPQTAPFRR